MDSIRIQISIGDDDIPLLVKYDYHIGRDPHDDPSEIIIHDATVSEGVGDYKKDQWFNFEEYRVEIEEAILQKLSRIWP